MGMHPLARLQRYAGRGAPLRLIIAIKHQGSLGRWVILDCGHPREIRDYDIMPAMNRKRPTRARCGVCRAIADGETWEPDD